MSVCVQGSDVQWYRCLAIFNGNIPDVFGKRGRVLDIAFCL